MSQKSQEIISKALLNLMETSPFDEITVSEICAHTSLVRKTFYNNFSSKEDVISYIVTNLIQQYTSMIIEQKQFTQQSMSYLFFQFGQQNKDTLLLLIKYKLFYIFQCEFKEQLPYINRMVPNNSLTDLKDDEVSYIFAFNTAGITCLLELWLKNNLNKTPEEMSTLYMTAARDYRALLVP